MLKAVKDFSEKYIWWDMTEENVIRLLLVDDERMNTLILAKRLKKEGYVTTEAFDGVEAVEAASKDPQPMIVLMDLMMPRMDGWEATKIIKEKYPHIKILAVSAKVDEEQRVVEKASMDSVPSP